MKRAAMMMVAAGLATLGSMTAARAQTDTGRPAQAEPGHPAQADHGHPSTDAPKPRLPASIPDNAEPVSPMNPVMPGNLPPLATADAFPPPGPPPRPIVTPAPVTPYEGERPYPLWITKMGSAIMLGGGFEDFTQSAPKSVTSGGGSWNLRLAAGTRQFVGLEAAYVGAARGANALGFTSNTTLVSNGFEGALRVNVPVAAGLMLIEPFGFVGLGWEHYHLSKTVATADISNSDDVMTLPYGAGLMFAYGMLMLDARVTLRETYFNDMFRASNSKLNTWGAGGNIGVEF
jgi:hypothetical protein